MFRSAGPSSDRGRRPPQAVRPIHLLVPAGRALTSRFRLTPSDRHREWRTRRQPREGRGRSNPDRISGGARPVRRSGGLAAGDRLAQAFEPFEPFELRPCVRAVGARRSRLGLELASILPSTTRDAGHSSSRRSSLRGFRRDPRRPSRLDLPSREVVRDLPRGPDEHGGTAVAIAIRRAHDSGADYGPCFSRVITMIIPSTTSLSRSMMHPCTTAPTGFPVRSRLQVSRRVGVRRCKCRPKVITASVHLDPGFDLERRKRACYHRSSRRHFGERPRSRTTMDERYPDPRVAPERDGRDFAERCAQAFWDENRVFEVREDPPARSSTACRCSRTRAGSCTWGTCATTPSAT